MQQAGAFPAGFARAGRQTRPLNTIHGKHSMAVIDTVLRFFIGTRNERLVKAMQPEVEKILALFPVTNRYTDEELDRRIEGCPKLASLKSINRALTELVNSEQGLNSQIAEIIRRDPSLTARLLRDGRAEHADACFAFLPTRAKLDLLGWEETDIFAHS